MAAKNQAILAGWKSAMVWVTLRPSASLKNGQGADMILLRSFLCCGPQKLLGFANQYDRATGRNVKSTLRPCS